MLSGLFGLVIPINGEAAGAGCCAAVCPRVDVAPKLLLVVTLAVRFTSPELMTGLVVAAVFGYFNPDIRLEDAVVFADAGGEQAVRKLVCIGDDAADDLAVGMSVNIF